jgi:hypothetical protein
VLVVLGVLQLNLLVVTLLAQGLYQLFQVVP